MCVWVLAMCVCHIQKNDSFTTGCSNAGIVYVIFYLSTIIIIIVYPIYYYSIVYPTTHMFIELKSIYLIITFDNIIIHNDDTSTQFKT